MISNLSKLVNEAGNSRGNVQREHTIMNTQQSKDIVVYVGADISKDTIDISYHFSSKLISDKIANNEKAIKKFVRSMKLEKGAVPHFILEATGYYSLTLYKTLRDMKVRFTQLNPRLSHRFAGFTGVLEKTDKKDAQILEDYGRLVTPKATIPDEDEQIELHNLYVLRNALAKERGEWKQRKHQHKQGIAKRVVEKVSTALDKEIAALDDTIEQKIISMETYKDIYKEIVKIVGVGRNTACAILCLLPEVGTLCSNKICKLAGLAPIANESGTSIKKTAHTQGGRKHLRTALYMPCMTACSYNPVIRACFQRIKARKGGDEVKGAGAIALTACMRKLLKHINSVARKVREEMQRNVAAEGCGEAAQASPCR